MKQTIVMVGISASKNDFLISLPILKAYLNQFKDIRDKYDIIIKRYHKNNVNVMEDLDVKSIAEEISQLHPDYVCFSCFVWNIKSIIEISEILRKESWMTRIIFGGAEITQESIDFGRYEDINVDYLVVGEGEKQLYKILLNEEPPEQQFNEYPSAYLNNGIDKDIFKNKDLRCSFETQRGCPMLL